MRRLVLLRRYQGGLRRWLVAARGEHPGTWLSSRGRPSVSAWLPYRCP